MTLISKEKIERNFDRGAINYDWAAVVQKEVADNLMDFAPQQEPQKILEIGCGTGFLTKRLLQKYPSADITAIDISSKMIEKCRSNFPFTRFIKADAETYDPLEKYDLIISNMTFQWLQNPSKAIARYTNFLMPTGKIIFSTLGENNFWEWNDVLKNLNLSSGLLKPYQYQGIVKEEEIKTMYQNPLDFIKSLKETGASHSSTKPLSPIELKQACNDFEKRHCCSMTWHILYGCVENN